MTQARSSNYIDGTSLSGFSTEFDTDISIFRVRAHSAAGACQSSGLAQIACNGDRSAASNPCLDGALTNRLAAVTFETDGTSQYYVAVSDRFNRGGRVLLTLQELPMTQPFPPSPPLVPRAPITTPSFLPPQISPSQPPFMSVSPAAPPYSPTPALYTNESLRIAWERAISTNSQSSWHTIQLGSSRDLESTVFEMSQPLVR